MAALDYAERLVQNAGYHKPEQLGLDTFDQYSKFVAYLAKDLKPTKILTDWALTWRRMYDNFDKIVQSDPMVLYRPKHEVAYQFHSSPAFIRYFRAGNRTSKTQSGYAEDYFVATGQHRWRKQPGGSVFIVGLAFSKYAPGVFEKKFIAGETANTLSPMFPEGGKWLNHYDARRHIITIACKNCAKAGKAGTCSHQKTTISLFSDESGWEILQGRQDRLGHFDEHIAQGFYQEAKQRLGSVPNSSLIVTGTPLFGLNSWESTLAALASGDPEKNKQHDGSPIVSLHEIDQFAAGLVPHDVIRRNMVDMTDFEIKARVYGKPSPLTDSPVFNLKILDEMYKACTVGTPHILDTVVLQENNRKPLEEVVSALDIDPITLHEAGEEWSGLRVWEPPVVGGQYILSVDTARGLAGGDASCCSVIKLEPQGNRLHLHMVAQYHGWINAFDYGTEVFKMAVWYNDGLVVAELTGGFGDAVVLRLKQLTYWNIFRDTVSPSAVAFGQDYRFGVETNASSKPFMVAALQQAVRDKTIHVPCTKTIEEMVAFEQVNTTKDGKRLTTPKYQGAGGSHDDRVMSLVIAASVAISHPVFDFTADQELKLKQAKRESAMFEEEESWAQYT